MTASDMPSVPAHRALLEAIPNEVLLNPRMLGRYVQRNRLRLSLLDIANERKRRLDAWRPESEVAADGR